MPVCAVAFLYLPTVFAGKRIHIKTPLRDVSCSEESASGRIVPPRVFALERLNAFGVCGTGANDNMDDRGWGDRLGVRSS